MFRQLNKLEELKRKKNVKGKLKEWIAFRTVVTFSLTIYNFKEMVVFITSEQWICQNIKYRLSSYLSSDTQPDSKV